MKPDCTRPSVVYTGCNGLQKAECWHQSLRLVASVIAGALAASRKHAWKPILYH